MELKLEQICAAIGGTLEGPFDHSERRAARVCTPEEPTADGICFAFDVASLARLGDRPVAVVVLPPGITLPGRTVIRVAEPRAALIAALDLFHPQPRPAPGISPAATVAADARLADDVFVAAGARIGARTVLAAGVEVHANAVVGDDVTIGAGSVIHANATLAAGTRVGRRVIVHSGAVVGSDGFGYHRDAEGTFHKIPQIGIVVLEDEVEVGAGATVDRATIGRTVIGRGSKVDNQVQIAHNCVVGEDCCLVAQAGLAGSVTLGDRVLIGGQAGVSDHVRIAADARVAAQGGVAEDLGPGDWMGAPAAPAARVRRVVALTARLPELHAELRDLRQRCAALEAALAARA